jgi:hypothetical protein
MSKEQEPRKNIEIPSFNDYTIDQLIQVLKEYRQIYGGSAIYHYDEYEEEDYGYSWTEKRSSLDVRVSKLKEIK